MVQRKEFPPLLIRLHQLLQSISKSRNSYLKDTTDFINYIFLKKRGKIQHFLFWLTRHMSWQLQHKTRVFKQFAEGIKISANLRQLSYSLTHYQLESPKYQFRQGIANSSTTQNVLFHLLNTCTFCKYYGMQCSCCKVVKYLFKALIHSGTAFLISIFMGN